METDSKLLLQQVQYEQVEIPPPWPGANKNLLGLGGAWIDPIKRLSIFDPNEFETFTLQWVYGYLSETYCEVQNRGGAGDKGRDIVAWIDPPKGKDAKWVNYQCKHYRDPLTPTDIWVELGKLCYFTYYNHFAIPQKYVFVSPKGAGSTLQDLIDNPDKLCQGLMSNWEKYCELKITSRARVPLEGKLRQYVERFDFSIFSALSPHELIEQHSKTQYHSYVFGTQLKERPVSPKPPPEIETKETRYVQQIYEAFADHLKCEIKDPSSFLQHKFLVSAFNHARESFYSAESLKEFARDSLPHGNYFTDLLNQFLDGLQIVFYETHQDGYQRMLAAGKHAHSLQIDTNRLRADLRPNDRVGICHQLANEDKLRWVD